MRASMLIVISMYVCRYSFLARYCDLVAKEGEATASALRDSKRQLEAERNPEEDEHPWVMAHPDYPKLEDLALNLINVHSMH